MKRRGAHNSLPQNSITLDGDSKEIAPVGLILRATGASGDCKTSPASNGLKYTKEKTPLPRKNVEYFNPSLAKEAIQAGSWLITRQLRGDKRTLSPSLAMK